MRALVIVLLVASAAIRIWATGEARFTGDEAEQWATARAIATFERQPIFGPAITGSPARLPGAFYYYLSAVPQFLGSSPRIGGIFIALMHVLAGFLMMKLAEDGRDKKTGLIFLVLFAFAPWDVLYGDRVWSACVTPVLGTLAIYAAAKSRDSARWQGVLAFLLPVLPQLHFSAPMAWIACAIILILRPPVKWYRKELLIGLGVAFITYLPPLIHEVQHDFQNTRAIFGYAGGKEPMSYVVWLPIKTFIYAVVFGSSDTAYNFEKGYWGGRFDELRSYFSLAAYSGGRWFDLLSILIALTGWGVALKVTKPRSKELEPVLVQAIGASYIVGAILLIISKKLFFPHYISLLIPAALLPIAFGLARLPKNAGLVAAAVSMVAMAISTVRYYREVDSLNGVDATLEMVGRAVEEKGPISLVFEGYPNDYAWREVARVHYGKTLLIDQRADVRYLVHNRERGPSLYERTVLRPAGLVARATEILPGIRVESELADGTKKECTATEKGCRYGDQPWYEIRPEVFDVRNKKELLLFMHPIERGRVTAHVSVPKKASRGALRYGLSDSATRSDNKSPVDLVLRVDGKNEQSGSARNEPGLKVLPFALTSTSTEISVEIRTEKEGARVFGFDVDFYE